MMSFKSVLQRISEFFADLRDDWRGFWQHGPQRWMRGLSHDFQDWWGSILDWKRRATRKVSEEERQLAKKRRAERRREFAHDFRVGLVRFLTLPWRLATGLGKYLLRLREMSFRDAVADLGESYVTWLAGLLDWIADRWRSFLQFPLWLRGVYTLLLLSLLSLGAASPWLIKKLKDHRAREMMAEAKSEQGSGDLVDAFLKSRAVALMRPNDPEALELVLDLADNVGAPEAVWWSERVAQVQGEDADAIGRIVETALRHRRIDKADRSFALMKSRYPEHESLAETEVRLLLARNNQVEALHRAYSALRAGNDSPLLHEVYVGLGLFSSNQDFSAQSFEHLKQHVYRSDEVGLVLSRLVFSRGIQSPEEDGGLDYERLIAMVETHEQANLADRITAYGMAMRLGISDRETTENKILAQFDLADDDQLLAALSSLGTLGLYESYARIITPELLAREGDFVLAKIAGLVLSEEPDLDAAEAVLEAVQTKELASISDAKAALWRAVIAGRKDDADAMSREIIAAVDLSGAREWSYLAQVLAKTMKPEQVLLFYRELFEHSGRNPQVTSRYLRIAYNYAQENELTRLVRLLPLDVLKPDPQSQLLLIYLKLLYAPESQQASRRYAEQLAVDHPDDIAYLICLAYAYARSGQQDYASRLIAFWSPGDLLQTLPPFLQLSYLTVNPELANILAPETLPTARERELLQQLIRGDEIES